tara:strand:- start:43 stop:228 length:186 start_codon:yes stop_codon:yes gene_type:complete
MAKTDYDKFYEERNAATLLRDELCWIVGYTTGCEDGHLRVVNERLEKALKEHDAKRCQSWI